MSSFMQYVYIIGLELLLLVVRNLFFMESLSCFGRPNVGSCDVFLKWFMLSRLNFYLYVHLNRSLISKFDKRFDNLAIFIVLLFPVSSEFFSLFQLEELHCWPLCCRSVELYGRYEVVLVRWPYLLIVDKGHMSLQQTSSTEP